MSRRKAVLSVPEILAKSQLNLGTHGKCAELLWALQQDDPDGTWEALKACMQHLLTFHQVATDRMLESSTTK